MGPSWGMDELKGGIWLVWHTHSTKSQFMDKVGLSLFTLKVKKKDAERDWTEDSGISIGSQAKRTLRDAWREKETIWDICHKKQTIRSNSDYKILKNVTTTTTLFCQVFLCKKNSIDLDTFSTHSVWAYWMLDQRISPV